MIEIKNVVKKFDDVVALKDLSLTLEDGIIGLVGHNGAGKSTLLRCISDVYILDEGDIFIDGEKNNCNSAKKKIFFLSDSPFFLRRSSIANVLALYSLAYEIDEAKFYEIIKAFNLPLNRRIDGFSKGMLRQLFVAIALSVKADILLLDEAFDGLDPLITEKIKDLLIEKRKTTSIIVISSHNISSLEKLVDHYVILSNGKLKENKGNKEEAKTYVKYQMMTDIDLSHFEPSKCLLDIISFTKVGSIYHIVVVKEDDLENKLKILFKPKLLEMIPIDSSELIKASMKMEKEINENVD